MAFGWDDVIVAGIGFLASRAKNDTQKELADSNTRTTAVEDLLRRIGSVSTQAEQLRIFEEAFGTEITNQLRAQGTITNETRATTETATQARQLAEQVNSVVEERATVLRGDVATQEALGALQAELGELPDTAAAVDAAINRVLRSGLPAVTNVLAQSGGFDSTTAAILQNDLIQKAAESAATLQLQSQETNIAQRLEAIQAGQAATEVTTGIAETAAETTQLEDVLSQLSEIVDIETIQQIEELIQVETETTQTTTSEQERLVEEQTLQEEIASTVSDEFINVGRTGATVVPGTVLAGAVRGEERPELPESTLPVLPALTLLPEADTPIPEPTVPLPPQTGPALTEAERRRRLEEEELSNLLSNRLTGRSTIVS